ncbi:putative T7SS-secreted protein [Nocardia sp. FBN12]|uniref:putative T7SS-secreted protein n=1 Tax=Nocardia sp. FBN12 TaxID=3419766 RepID=UPI003D05AC48
MGIGDFIDKVGSAIEDGVEDLVEGAGQVIDDGLDMVGDAAGYVGLDSVDDALDDLGDNIAAATGGDVEEEELGQTEDPKELILGEPSEIGSTAETLKKMAAAIESTGQALQKIDAAAWTGKGADAFNEVYDKQPKLWFDGGDAMTAAAGALEAWQNEVKTAQDKAGTAIERWKAAHAEEVRQKNWWNSLTGEQQAQNPLVDTWTSLRNEAREILRGARIQRDNGASIADGALAAATEKAPKEPPFSERWIANISDLGGVLEHGALNFSAGLLTSLTGLVQFVRQVNPTDIYNITHPADYVEGLSNLGTGLVVAVADPGATVDAILKDARANPFEFVGALTGDALLTAATGGGGSAKVAISALKKVTDAGRRLPDGGSGPSPHNPSSHRQNPTGEGAPTRHNDPTGQTGERQGAGLPDSDRGPAPEGRPIEGAPQREAPTQRTEDTGDAYSPTSDHTEPRHSEPPARTERDEPSTPTETPSSTPDPEPTRQSEPTPTPDRTPDADPPTSRPEPRPEAAATSTTDSTPNQRADQTPAQQTDHTPTQRTDPTLDQQTDRTPTQRTDPTPTQQTDPTPTQQTDHTPTQRTDPTPAQQTDHTPTQRTDPASTHQTNPDSPATPHGDSPRSQADSDTTPHTDQDTDPTQHRDPDRTPREDSSAPETRLNLTGDRTPHTNDAPADVDTRPTGHPDPTPQTSSPTTPVAGWQPGHSTNPDNSPAHRPTPDAQPARTHPGATPSHPPQSPRGDSIPQRPHHDPGTGPRKSPDSPRAGAAPDPAVRANGHSPLTAGPHPDSPTRSTPGHTPARADAEAPARPHPDSHGRGPDHDPDKPRDRTDRRSPDHEPAPKDRTPERDPATPTDRTPNRDSNTPTDRTPHRDTDPDHDSPTERDRDTDNDRDTPTAQDRADGDRDAHDEARKSGAEHDRTPDQKTCSTDPVDISTGEFLLPETDVELAGVLPLVLRRSHHSNYRFGRWFGPSWSGTLDARVVASDEGVTFIGEDGIMLAYPHAEAGEPVRPLTDGQGWSLTRTDAGGYRVWDQRRELIWHFAPEPVLDGLEVMLGNYAVSAITDRHHNRIRFHYDADGVPVEVSHSGGYRVRVETAHGRITGLALISDDPELGETTIPLREFDYAAGQLMAVTNAVTATTCYTYDAEHRMTSWTDSNGNRMVNTYDESGRVIHQRGSAGILNCDFDYVEFPGGAGRLTAVTDSIGAVTSHGFDRDLQLRDLVTPDGGHFHTDYNAERKPLTVTGPDPATITTYRYNGAGDPVEITRPDGVSIDYEYTWRNRPTTITTADGAVHRREWSDNGDLTAAIDPSGSRTEFTFHRSGALASVLAEGVRTTVDVDAAGLPIALVDPLGATTRIERDAAGRPVRTVDPAGAVTLYQWSPAGNLLRRTEPDGRHESWAYDGEGNLVAHTDPAGGVTEYSYGAFDLLESRTDSDGSITRYGWDTERRLTAVRNPLGQTWTYAYDTAGRLIAETDYGAATTTYTWDSAGRIATVTPATGVTRRHRYDILGRRTEMVTDDGDLIRYTYDQAGRIRTARTGNGAARGHTVEYTYGPTGLLESEQVDARPPMRFTYDQHGRRIGRTSPTGAETSWHHDLAGRVDRIGIGTHDVTFEYDLAGHLTCWRTGEIAVNRQVTALGQLLGQEVTAFPARLVSLDLDRPARPAPRRVRRDEFLYRADGYLTSHTTARPNAPALHRDYALDTRGRITTVAHNDHPAERYSYDPLGNITAGAQSAAPPTLRTYRDNLLIHDTRSRYDYDRAGRLIRKTAGEHTWHYRYNSFDQLIDVYTPDRQWWHYTYDALGRRTTKQHLTDDGTVLERIDFTWDDTRLIESTTATTTTRWDYQPGTHTPLTQSIDRPTSAEFCAIITDLVGTPTELIDPTTAEPTATATTTLWGHTTWHGTTSTPLRFPGQFHDPESDLHDNLHRVYNPHTARYLTRDPLGLTPAPNPHTYPHNPRTWRDPLGLIPDECKDPTPDPDGDRTPDPHSVTPPDPTPAQPTVDTGQLPVAPETVPDPNTSSGAGRTGTGDESPEGLREPLQDEIIDGRRTIMDQNGVPHVLSDTPDNAASAAARDFLNDELARTGRAYDPRTGNGSQVFFQDDLNRLMEKGHINGTVTGTTADMVEVTWRNGHITEVRSIDATESSGMNADNIRRTLMNKLAEGRKYQTERAIFVAKNDEQARLVAEAVADEPRVRVINPATGFDSGPGWQ